MLLEKKKNEVKEFYNFLKEPEIREKKLEIGSSYTWEGGS